MNKILLSALLGGVAKVAAVATTWTPVDDPRCHDDPNNPVIPPSPTPTPFPSPPTPIDVWDPPPPNPTLAPTVTCPGDVSGFVVYDLDTDAAVMDIEDGMTLELSQLPARFSVKAVVPEGTSSQFALFNTDTQEVVPGYEVLADDQILDLTALPDNLSIIAVTNGRGSGPVVFGLGGDSSYATETSAPYAISGKDGSSVTPWTGWDEAFDGKLTISAYSSDMAGSTETGDDVCEITLKIIPDCVSLVETIHLIDTTCPTGNCIIPGYEDLKGHRVLDLSKLPSHMSMWVPSQPNLSRVRFYLKEGNNYREIQSEGAKPYALNGDSNKGEFTSTFNPEPFLTEPGEYELIVRGEGPSGLEAASDVCSLRLTIGHPEKVINTIDDDDVCGAEAVVPEQEGQHIFQSKPVEIVSRVVNETVSFKVKQTIRSDSMDWITTSFVTSSGVRVCDKMLNMDPGQVSEHVYEAKCFNGFAYADVYGYDTDFSPSQASADTTMLPSACKNSFEGKVVKYTFVFSCDCDAIPDIPDEFTGGPKEKAAICSGTTAYSWGDPHVVSFGGKSWGCQGEGEFILATAELANYNYNFELRARYTMFGQDLPWTFNSAMIAKQGDVSVQLDMGEEELPTSNMFDGVPINFYVNGVPRLISEGSGDHRVLVTLNERNVNIYFVSTGISIRVLIRPFSKDSHSGIMTKKEAMLNGTIVQTIPGSLSTYLCLPNDNSYITDVTGLLGSPGVGNFMDSTTGLSVSQPSDTTGWCKEQWCVKDEASSMFEYRSGYDFNFYNKCDDPARRHLEEEITVDDLTPEVAEICAKVDYAMECLEDGAAGGVSSAQAAVEAIMLGKAIEQAPIQLPGETACCSDDFKNCIDPVVCPPNPYKCGDCVSDGTFIFMLYGDLYTQDEMYSTNGCLAEYESCTAEDSCCPGTTCVAGQCKADSNSRRRLQEFEFTLRPETTIVPLGDEL
eukprot:scaffold10501_cov141-Amphora_coffeaeformis.AAC.14